MINLYFIVTKIFLTIINKRQNHYKLDLEKEHFKLYLLNLFIHTKKELKCNNTVKQYKNISLCLYKKKRHKGYNLNLLQIPKHPYIILITGCCWSVKNVNLISYHSDTDQIHLYASTELFIRSRKLNIYPAFIAQS